MVAHRGLVIHIAEGTYEGTIAWQKNPASQVSSHFVVDTDGTIAQVVDTDVTAWTQRLGNGSWLSVEFAGHTPNPLTAAQVEACAQLFATGSLLYGYPLQIATSPNGYGLGHHSMGAENGIDWGHSDCPGPAIIAQKPAILARAIQIVNGGDMTPTESWVQHVMNYRLWAIMNMRTPLNVPARLDLGSTHIAYTEPVPIVAAVTSTGQAVTELRAAVDAIGQHLDAITQALGILTTPPPPNPGVDITALRAQIRADVQELLIDLATGGSEAVRNDTTPAGA